MKKLRKFLNLPSRKKTLFLEVVLFLTIAEMLKRFVPFRHFHHFLGKTMRESPFGTRNHHETIKEISWAIITAAANVPWKPMCLTQAIAAKVVLKRRNIGNTLYLGVSKEEGNELIAHAWVRSGKFIVTGAKGKEDFKVISSFA